MIGEGSSEALGVLGFVNAATTTPMVLDLDVGIDSRAAANIVTHRNGPDGRAGTDDDDLFETIAELDSVGYVGDRELTRLLDYCVDAGLIADDGTRIVEGVAFSEVEAQLTLRLANTAAHDTLDFEVGLDARAARGIVDTRPFETLESLGEVAYVGASALTLLRDFANARNAVTQDAFSTLTEAADGLWYISEGDYPLEPFVLVSPGYIREANVKNVLGHMVELSPYDDETLEEKGVEERDVAAFFDRLTVPEDWWEAEEYEEAQRWQAVRDVFEQDLQSATVFRIGSGDDGWVYGTVDVFIIGYTADGDVVGAHTLSIET